MRRLLTIALALAILTALAGPANAQPKHPERALFCRYGSLDNGRWTEREVHAEIRCALTHWNAGTFTHAHAIAERESGDYWGAHNPSGASGIYQNLASLWPGRVAAFNASHPRWHAAPSVWNARSSVIVSIWLASMTNWGPWGG